MKFNTNETNLINLHAIQGIRTNLQMPKCEKRHSPRCHDSVLLEIFSLADNLGKHIVSVSTEKPLQ